MCSLNAPFLRRIDEVTTAERLIKTEMKARRQVHVGIDQQWSKAISIIMIESFFKFYRTGSASLERNRAHNAGRMGTAERGGACRLHANRTRYVKGKNVKSVD